CRHAPRSTPFPYTTLFRSVEKAGLAFIGPSAATMDRMGAKDTAKAIMEKAGVPVVPGYHGAEQDGKFLAGKAKEIGFPLMIKARSEEHTSELQSRENLVCR